MIYYIFRLTCSGGPAGVPGVCESKEWVSSRHSHTVHPNVKGLSRIPGGCWVVVASGDSFSSTSIYAISYQCLSESNISNNLAAIRAFHIIHGLPTHPFQDRQIPLLLKSIKINRPFLPKMAQALTIKRLHQVIAISGLEHNVTFTALYSFIFFSFLRLSNLLPHTTGQYDFTRHMARGDVIFTQCGATVIIKWSKTIQDRKETRTINIPYLGHSEICPIVALKTMRCHIPGSENDPLFMIKKKGFPMVLTDSMAPKHLKKVSQLLDIQPPLTFHAFRRAASSWAFQHGVPL